jgi:hypothetical protein
MTLRLRYLTLKLRALCWALRRLRRHRPGRARGQGVARAWPENYIRIEFPPRPGICRGIVAAARGAGRYPKVTLDAITVCFSRRFT